MYQVSSIHVWFNGCKCYKRIWTSRERHAPHSASRPYPHILCLYLELRWKVEWCKYLLKFFAVLLPPAYYVADRRLMELCLYVDCSIHLILLYPNSMFALLAVIDIDKSGTAIRVWISTDQQYDWRSCSQDLELAFPYRFGWLMASLSWQFLQL